MGEKTQKNIYLIGIWGIGVSAIARYYLSKWWNVYGSDSTDSEIITSLKDEGCNIIIGADKNRITSNIEKVVYTEAIPRAQEEFHKAQELWLEMEKYNVALSKIANQRKLIAVTGTHGKSTTTSLISIIFKNSDVNFVSIVGTLLKEFDGKNFYQRSINSWENKHDEYCVIEACEHKEHFLAYTPSVLVITNIEYDHADYFSTPQQYIDAFEKLINNVVPGGFVILPENDSHANTLVGLRNDIHYIQVSRNSFTIGDATQFFPEIIMQVPGKHVLFDAKLAYIVGHMAGISDEDICTSLQNYTGVWRRMEIIGKTKWNNLLMSDYGHHPTEIEVTLQALREWYPERKILTIFQPHQYSRTIELLDGFKACFSGTDTLIIPDIYESRDTQENKEKMNTDILVGTIDHPDVHNGNGIKNTLQYINDYDTQNPDSSIILLLWAGNVDNLRYEINASPF